MPTKPTIPKINTYIVKRGDKILGTTPDENWAKSIAAVNERIQPGVTIEFGDLETAETWLRERRKFTVNAEP